jgi:IstB-like ATP binding protein
VLVAGNEVRRDATLRAKGYDLQFKDDHRVVGWRQDHLRNSIMTRISERQSLTGKKSLSHWCISTRNCERGSIVITSNKAFKQWPTIFNGDSTIASAVLDRLLHHAETIIIEGSSYRMKDRIET